MHFHRSCAALAVVAGLLFAPLAVAEEGPGGTVALTVDLEKFNWQELQPGDIPSWEDDGPRVGIGVAWSNLRTPSGGPVYRGTARLYLGAVDAQDSVTPASTETNYIGVQAEGLGGYRFGGKVGFELVSGIGVDVWQRDIQDASDTITYFSELWAVLNAKLGVGFFTRTDNFGFALRGGPKLPLVSWSRWYVWDGVDVSPEGRLSWFGQAEFSFGGQGKDRFTLVFYYDSYKWDASDIETVSFGGVPAALAQQPDTEMSVFGARIAFGF